LPTYDREELEELLKEDRATVEGRGDVGDLRESPGWQDSEAQQRLDEWQEDARRRLAQVEELGDQWREAYEFDVNDEDLEDQL
jgi:hypothetical protein